MARVYKGNAPASLSILGRLLWVTARSVAEVSKRKTRRLRDASVVDDASVALVAEDVEPEIVADARRTAKRFPEFSPWLLTPSEWAC